MDRFEVTNRQFKAFVDAGGYTNRRILEGAVRRERPHDAVGDAMARFRDRTGRPGPSTWELGTFPQGQADFPVSGVSWYEAAAYAVFAGKSLPTAFQWRRAGDFAGPSGVYRRHPACTATSTARGRRRSARIRGIGRTASSTWRATSRNGAGTSRAAAG